MKKSINILSIGSSILLLIYTVFKLLDHGSFKFALVTYGVFAVIFICSFISVFQKKWIPLTIQLITLLIVFIVPPMIRTEVNFYQYKEDREEIIQLLIDGDIKKEEGGNKGFAHYYTPPQYIDAVKWTTIWARMHSENKFFVFFQSAEQPFLEMRGLTEGFIYSSTGEFPTAKEFGYFTGYDYKKIDQHWYFVSNNPERFEQSCLFLCE